jgi:hypothetical protein
MIILGRSTLNTPPGLSQHFLWKWSILFFVKAREAIHVWYFPYRCATQTDNAGIPDSKIRALHGISRPRAIRMAVREP